MAVLTATIGAAALIRNCLFCYLQRVTQTKCRGPPGEKSGSLKVSHKQYSEMAEALAERLLDLHCRLLSLYILQDADCLDWENPQPFFESERGSYIIQMWWLYMKGDNSILESIRKCIFACKMITEVFHDPSKKSKYSYIERFCLLMKNN